MSIRRLRGLGMKRKQARNTRYRKKGAYRSRDKAEAEARRLRRKGKHVKIVKEAGLFVLKIAVVVEGIASIPPFFH